MTKDLPSIDTLRKLLRYEPDTGKLFWLARPPEMFSSDRSCKIFNTQYAGQEAFTAIAKNGYAVGRIFQRGYLAHRVIWAMATGSWPNDMIDHINGDKRDNRIKNLREASRSENMRNRKSNKTATSKYLGVCWNRQRGMWMAQINSKYIGLFDCEIKAALAYDSAAQTHHGAFARLNFTQENHK